MAAGAGGTHEPAARGAGQRLAAMGYGDAGAKGSGSQEARPASGEEEGSGGCDGAEASRAAAPVVGHGRGIRSAVQRQAGGQESESQGGRQERESGGLTETRLAMVRFAERRVRVTAWS